MGSLDHVADIATTYHGGDKRLALFGSSSYLPKIR